MALAQTGGEGAGRTSGWYGLFGLSSDPFGEDSGDYYYGSRYGVESLRLEQALERKRGVVVVTGPPRTGKSALLRSALAHVETAAVATISAADRPPASVIEALAGGDDPEPERAASAPRRARLLRILRKAHAAGRPVVCVVEDAHCANAGQLRELIAALEVTAETQGVVQVVLVGDPELNRTLQSSALKPLRTRITARIETARLSAGEVAEFAMDRLEFAGSTAAARIFPPATIAAIHRLTRGEIAGVAPIARASLIRATEMGSFSVSPEHVEHAVARCEHLQPAPLPGRLAALGPLRNWVTSASALGLIVLALAVAAAQVKMIGGPRKPVEASLAAIQAVAESGTTESDNTEAIAERTVSDRTVYAALFAQLRSPREEFLSGTPYEVEIAPPPRPGSAPTRVDNPPIVEMPLPPSAPGDFGDPGATRQPDAGPSGMPATPFPPAPSSSSGNTQPPPDLPGWPGSPELRNSSSPANAPAGPHVSLQVGAFRDMRSANALRTNLSRSFPDVHISTIDSGGEPLHRVRVGRFGTAEESLPLKQRLQAMGYPSFRVDER